MFICRGSISMRPGSSGEPPSTSPSCTFVRVYIENCRGHGEKAYGEHGAVGVDIRRIDELLKIAGRIFPKCALCIHLFSRDKVDVQR
jgi:hypothetical protein